jgi:hypothetical protein
MQTFSTAGSRAAIFAAGQRVVGLELDHRPRRDAHCDKRLFKRHELCVERGVNTLPRLVAQPELVAE